MCHASDTRSPQVYQNVAFAGSAQRVSFRKDKLPDKIHALHQICILLLVQ